MHERLVVVDKMLSSNPKVAMDSLSAMSSSLMNMEDVAYYNLLITIAGHKNGIWAANDSVISSSRRWYESHADDYNLTRSLFYNGVVLSHLNPLDTLAYAMMRKSWFVSEEKRINDTRLKALIAAYLGKMNDIARNFDEAEYFYREAVGLEIRNGNARNMCLDQNSLLSCLVEKVDKDAARHEITVLDSMLSAHPELSINNVNNTKALYYLHIDCNLDSAILYCRRWIPAESDKSAKMKLMGTFHRKMGNLDSAIFYEKAALSCVRPTDSLYKYVYLRNLSGLFRDRGQLDSALIYADESYKAMSSSLEELNKKRILELEKKYESESKDAEISRMKREHRLLWGVSLMLLVIIVLLLFFFLERRRRLRAMEESNRLLSERARLAEQLAASRESLLEMQRLKLEEAKMVKEIILSAADTYRDLLPRMRDLMTLAASQNNPLEGRINELYEFSRRNSTESLSTALANNTSFLQDESCKKAVELLNSPQEKAMLILFEQGYTYREISQAICCSEAHVRSLRSYIKKKLLKEAPESTWGDMKIMGQN